MHHTKSGFVIGAAIEKEDYLQIIINGLINIWIERKKTQADQA
ncbi:hypothetical protein LLT1_03600 [Lactococcus cremoris subsp. cremoris TIFN1]|nr:hypothetical protein LLT1_03600 [Lactococcus cremoris subsp. cremoris TIFN1]QGJ84449.1 hypothetical protein [Lactococcus phage proPhi1]QGJ84609.1 hypothetical protein [Lactococcus phage proPhi5]